MYVPRATYSLRMSFWTVPERDASGIPLQERLHVLQAVDGHSDSAHLPGRMGVVGVVADLGRQVESDREAGRSLPEEVAVTPVGLGGGAEARVLPHRPPAAAVTRGVKATGEGKDTRFADGFREIGQVFRAVDPLARQVGGGPEIGWGSGWRGVLTHGRPSRHEGASRRGLTARGSHPHNFSGSR